MWGCGRILWKLWVGRLGGRDRSVWSGREDSMMNGGASNDRDEAIVEREMRMLDSDKNEAMGEREKDLRLDPGN